MVETGVKRGRWERGCRKGGGEETERARRGSKKGQEDVRRDGWKEGARRLTKIRAMLRLFWPLLISEEPGFTLLKTSIFCSK